MDFENIQSILELNSPIEISLKLDELKDNPIGLSYLAFQSTDPLICMGAIARMIPSLHQEFIVLIALTHDNLTVRLKALNQLLSMPTLNDVGRDLTEDELIREKSNQLLVDMKRDLFFDL